MAAALQRLRHLRRQHHHRHHHGGVRLFWQVYLAVVGSLLLFFLLAGALFMITGTDRPPPARWYQAAGAVLADALPPADHPVAEQSAALQRLAARTGFPLGLYDRDGDRIAGPGPEHLIPRYVPGRRGSGPRAIPLPDGRRVLLIAPPPIAGEHDWEWHIVGLLGLLAIAIALAAWPVSRRLTRRLERLAERMDALGEGDLSARVDIRGHDEIARLATRFNRTAERIEALVGAHKSLLAHASHELRSPLARLRMAAELLGEQAPPALHDELVRNVRELDELVEEILLMSRLDAQTRQADPQEAVDLLTLCQEEAARVGATVSGSPVTLLGEARLLRRLIRNLLENAQRHGAKPITANLSQTDQTVTLRVCDAGAGIDDAYREKLFEPFFRPPGASESAGGYGLGLALVRNIARKHGGDVHYEAPANGGSCFVVRLPAADR